LVVEELTENILELNLFLFITL